MLLAVFQNNLETAMKSIARPKQSDHYHHHAIQIQTDEQNARIAITWFDSEDDIHTIFIGARIDIPGTVILDKNTMRELVPLLNKGERIDFELLEDNRFKIVSGNNKSTLKTKHNDIQEYFNDANPDSMQPIGSITIDDHIKRSLVFLSKLAKQELETFALTASNETIKLQATNKLSLGTITLFAEIEDELHTEISYNALDALRKLPSDTGVRILANDKRVTFETRHYRLSFKRYSTKFNSIVSKRFSNESAAIQTITIDKAALKGILVGNPDLMELSVTDNQLHATRSKGNTQTTSPISDNETNQEISFKTEDTKTLLALLTACKPDKCDKQEAKEQNELFKANDSSERVKADKNLYLQDHGDYLPKEFSYVGYTANVSLQTINDTHKYQYYAPGMTIRAIASCASLVLLLENGYEQIDDDKLSNGINTISIYDWDHYTAYRLVANVEKAIAESQSDNTGIEDSQSIEPIESDTDNTTGNELEPISESTEAIETDTDSDPILESIANHDNADSFMPVYEATKQLPDIDLSFTGYCLWATASDDSHNEQLQSLGFRYAHKKSAWYYKPMHENNLSIRMQKRANWEKRMISGDYVAVIKKSLYATGYDITVYKNEAWINSANAPTKREAKRIAASLIPELV